MVTVCSLSPIVHLSPWEATSSQVSEYKLGRQLPKQRRWQPPLVEGDGLLRVAKFDIIETHTCWILTRNMRWIPQHKSVSSEVRTAPWGRRRRMGVFQQENLLAMCLRMEIATFGESCSDQLAGSTLGSPAARRPGGWSAYTAGRRAPTARGAGSAPSRSPRRRPAATPQGY